MVQLPATAAIEYVAAGHFFPGGLLAGATFVRGGLLPGGLFPRESFARGHFWPGGFLAGGIFVREKSGNMNYYNYSVAAIIVQTIICDYNNSTIDHSQLIF